MFFHSLGQNKMFTAVIKQLDLNHFYWQAASPALDQLKAILHALDLPQPSKESTVFDLFTKIETKVSETKLPTIHNKLISINDPHIFYYYCNNFIIFIIILIMSVISLPCQNFYYFILANFISFFCFIYTTYSCIELTTRFSIIYIIILFVYF